MSGISRKYLNVSTCPEDMLVPCDNHDLGKMTQEDLPTSLQICSSTYIAVPDVTWPNVNPNGESVSPSVSGADSWDTNLKVKDRTSRIPKKYHCEYCGKEFSKLRNYKYHKSRHEGSNQFSCTCLICGKQFTDKGYLSSHMKIHRNAKEYECEYCGKGFNQRVAYNMHRQTHTGHRPHQCNLCGKSFNRRTNLNQHMRMHTGERPYVCGVCSKAFADKSNMLLHQKIHFGERPHVCQICKKRFCRISDLKTHLNRHVGIKPYECQKCHSRFSQSSNMKTHWKKCSTRPINVSQLSPTFTLDEDQVDRSRHPSQETIKSSSSVSSTSSMSVMDFQLDLLDVDSNLSSPPSSSMDNPVMTNVNGITIHDRTDFEGIGLSSSLGISNYYSPIGGNANHQISSPAFSLSLSINPNFGLDEYESGMHSISARSYYTEEAAISPPYSNASSMSRSVPSPTLSTIVQPDCLSNSDILRVDTGSIVELTPNNSPQAISSSKQCHIVPSQIVVPRDIQPSMQSPPISESEPFIPTSILEKEVIESVLRSPLELVSFLQSALKESVGGPF